ncbi:hypothetical protein H1V43_32100 [Streptomyces sp. PSKA54]|uniref:Uncharacterized protein n=1 Tax=Streptomyces himalayensis subsp. aureolus TaxID=2758039 RepID=A0A7W2HJA6_9ACTN|nr:hypothetical protein [Streptomyces himalayensis]MBA4865907.1 hypothetical protein [Streptomyces himalayensis subsp. aureolus]
MADDVQITVHVRDLTGPGFNSVNRNIDQLQRQANQMGASLRIVGGQLGNLSTAAGNAGQSMGGGMGLRGQLIGVAAALGTTLLPALGALSPMLFGLAGVGGAAALAMDDLKKEAKKLKPEFEQLQKAASKAVMPGVKRAMDDVKGAMKGLHPVVKEGGEAFGDFVERAADFANSPAFKGALLKNVEMGSGFFKDFTDSLMGFTQAFLDFGTKSQPTLDSFQRLFGGLLDSGLPGMFKGLERGVEGSSQVLDGLAYMLNDKLLPAFGRFAGELARVSGPYLKEFFSIVGGSGAGAMDALAGALRLAEPLIRDAAYGLRTIRDVAALVGPTVKDTALAIVGAFAPVGSEVDKAAGPFQRLNQWVKENKIGIMEASRVFGSAVLGMVGAAVESAPTIIEAFRFVSVGVLTAIDGMVSGLARAFGDVPVIGDKLKAANEDFDRFKGSFLSGLEAAETKSRNFANEVGPRLSAGKLKLDINNWESQIATAKAQMKSVPPSKRADLKAHIADLQAKVRRAKADLASVRSRTVTLTTRYVVVGGQARQSGAQGSQLKYARGGKVRGYAGGGNVQAYPDGGYVQGPGSGTSDDILTLLGSGNVIRSSNTEFIVNARATAKHRRLLEMINNDRLPRFAKGGSVGKAARGARDEIRAATSGSTERSLLRLMDAISKGHIKMATALKQVNSALEKAKDKLSDLKSVASQLKDSVKSGIISGANITRAATAGEGHVTVAGIMGGLTEGRDKASSFAKALKALKKKGLSKDLIAQIAEAGIEGGGLETAEALMGASKSELKSMNQLQKQISTAAGSAGQTAADAMYKAQIQVQEKLVKALDRVADALKNTKKKAVGGAAGGLTVVGEEGPELLRLPHGSTVYPAGQSRRMAWQSMLNAPRTMPARGGTAGAYPGAGRPIIVHQTITLDGQVIARQIFDPLRKEIRVRGGNVQSALGQGAG